MDLHFEVELVSGEPGLSNETLDVGYFSAEERERLDIMEPHLERIADTLANQEAAFIR